METYRQQGRPLYFRSTPDTYSYQNIYGTVRGNPSGKIRPALDLDSAASGGRNKKSFNFLPWKKNKSKGDEFLPASNGTLSKHNKYKFGSVSALSSGSMYKDWDSSLSYTPSYSASDLKHASVKSVGSRSRGLVTYPWETYAANNNNNNDVELKNSKNSQLNKIVNSRAVELNPVPGKTKSMSTGDSQTFNSSPCRCQKKKSGPFGTLNFNSLKSTKCNCGFSSVRSTRDFAPPPPPRRRSILPDKVDLYALHEEQDQPLSATHRKQDNIYDTLSRHGKYKAPSPPLSQVISYSPSISAQTKFAKSIEKCKNDPYNSVASRKSILECDVTAYDLVKSYLKNDSPNDTDIDDDLSDNVIETKAVQDTRCNKKNTVNSVDKLFKQTSNKSPSPVSSESESGIYSQAPSIRIAGHGMKIFQPSDGNGSQASSLYSDGSKTNSVDSRTSSWSNSSLSDDGIYSLPEPDYDDEKFINESDSVLKFNDKIYSTGSPRIKKYSSGGCLDKTDLLSLNKQERLSDVDSPRFSTIRKATSMVSLASGHITDGGTLRSRAKASRPPELPTVPSTTTVPPPPPPPPPPLPTSSDLNIRKPVKQAELSSENSETENQSKAENKKKFTGNNLSSSIASELSEKLKSNQPILKKNEVKPKQPMKVNSHNPYAEVKSILKKTGENLNTTNSNGSNSPENSKQALNIQDVQDPKKKKRVQFKSLSNESLAVEQFQHQTLSSSDEEWEEARDTFSNDSKPKDSVKSESSTPDSKKDKNDDFQTVEEFLSARKDETNTTRKVNQGKAASEKDDAKNIVKPPSIPRPSQPPPPPPNIRRTNVKGAPPPRPLSSAPKSFSHCDLRVSSTSNSRLPTRGPNLTKITTRDFTRANPCGNGGTGNIPKARISPVSTGTDVSRPLRKETTTTTTIPKNGVSSPAASLEAATSPRGKSISDTGDNGIASASYNNHLTTGLEEAEYADTKLNEDYLYENPPRDVATTADDSSSESSYMSLPVSVNSDKNENIYDDISNIEASSGNGNNAEVSPAIVNVVPAAITCTIISKSGGKCETDTSNHDSRAPGLPPRPKLCEELNQKNSDYSSSDEDFSSSSISGPVYSNLLYVPRKSPSPPPLPTTLPPLPPKKHQCLTILTINNAPVINATVQPLESRNDAEDLYDTLPLRIVPKAADPDKQNIYESRRYSDTGATVVTISSGASDAADNLYSSLNSEAIYEELPDWTTNYIENVSTNPFGRHRGSFFEGASKAEILKFLEVARQRVVDHLEDDILDDDSVISSAKNVRNNRIRISNISSSSDSSTISSNSSFSRNGDSSDDMSSLKSTRSFGAVEVERADSGVGSETSKPTVSKRNRTEEVEEVCADCDQQLENGTAEDGQCCPLVCKKCDKKRSERKEIVTEIVETEFKYGKDLLIIKEEFKNPMEVAGLLTKEQLNGVFLNLDELMLVNASFSEKLKDAVDIATEQGDEDYTTVSIGKLFLETTTMLKAFEIYCIRQGSASLLLASLEKEKELLRIFLRVSQMENTLLRRMNLSAFLMVPVQRVTKYPLLLNRLYKVTPYHHKDREALREAQLKIELHLEQINQQTKGITGTKIWRRISNISSANRRAINNISDIGSIQLRKMAIEVLEWSKEDIRFVMAGKLAFSGAVDFTKSKRGRAFKFTPSHALLATKGKPNSNYRPDLAQENSILFPRDTGIEDATLLLMKEKNGRYSLARDPLHLGTCVISAELEDEDIIEIQEYTTKESIFLKAECKSDTVEWLKQLKYHAKDLGTWKRRRNALANIMINGMIRQQ